MTRGRSITAVVAVGIVTVAFMFVLGPLRLVEESAYDFSAERTVSSQAFIDAVPPDWTAVRSRVPPLGGGPLFIASVPLPDPCREVGQSISCDGLPPIVLPPGGVLIRLDTARDVLGPSSLVTPPPEGEDLMLNGFRTKVVRVAGGACAGVGADETLTVVVPTLGDWIGRTTVVACLRGPDLDALERQVLALLARAAP